MKLKAVFALVALAFLSISFAGNATPMDVLTDDNTTPVISVDFDQTVLVAQLSTERSTEAINIRQVSTFTNNKATFLDTRNDQTILDTVSAPQATIDRQHGAVNDLYKADIFKRNQASETVLSAIDRRSGNSNCKERYLLNMQIITHIANRQRVN